MPQSNSLNDALRASAKAAPAPRDGPDGCAPSDGATKLVGAHFPEPVHRQLRVIAAQEGRTVQSVIAEAFNELFAKRKMPPIA